MNFSDALSRVIQFKHRIRRRSWSDDWVLRYSPEYLSLEIVNEKTNATSPDLYLCDMSACDWVDIDDAPFVPSPEKIEPDPGMDDHWYSDNPNY